MYVARADRTIGDEEWRPFVTAQGFGHLVAAGRDRPVPVVVPTQFLLDGDTVVLHLVARNPFFDAVAEQPAVLLSVAGDWAYIPSDWKAIGDEDPLLGIPTTYYGAVQLIGRARVDDDPAVLGAILRRQLEAVQPGRPVADPEEAHQRQLRGIRAVTIDIDEVRAKFKYGGNVDVEHRAAIAARLDARGGPGDRQAAGHLRRRSGLEPDA